MSIHKETEVRETYVYSAETFQIKVPERLFEDWQTKFEKWKNTEKMNTLKRKITNYIQKSMKKMLENPATGDQWQKDFNELFAVVTQDLEGKQIKEITEMDEQIEEINNIEEPMFKCPECGVANNTDNEDGCLNCGWKEKEEFEE